MTEPGLPRSGTAREWLKRGSAETMTELAHEPVLLREVLELLPTDPEGRYLDATFGLGGHALAVLERLPRAKVLGLEADPWVVSAFHEARTAPPGLRLECANFRDCAEILRREEFLPLAGALLDLGVGAFHYKASGRGFGFAGPSEPLDMRLSPDSPLPASRILNEWPLDQIERVLKEYGEEPQARRIAQEVVRRRASRPWTTTGDLLELFENLRGGPGRSARGMHPATRTFLALRIAVNRELENLSRALAGLPACLAPGGRLAVLTFHSLEDRIAKYAFRELIRTAGFEAVTRSPVRPQPAEIQRNPRARSAKLRVVEKL